jgi:hypothetical protein
MVVQGRHLPDFLAMGITRTLEGHDQKIVL